jgi:glutathione synthase/RimK-type ligase-like ATP-grasp enzyme
MPAERPRVALATAAGFPQLAVDDRALVPILERLGASVDVRVWNDPVSWQPAPDAVVIRSCWDYHLHLDAFLRWIDRLKAAGALVLNPPALVAWNARKRYLLDLAAAGVGTGVPTTILPPSEADRVAAVLRDLLEHDGARWAEVVAKPEVSASAYRTARLRPLAGSADLAALEQLVRDGATLIQPYLPEIAELGEWSLVFFGGEFSHAVLKRPAAGDFRVQAEHGGSTEAMPPSDRLLVYAGTVLRAAAGRVGLGLAQVTYARVDVIDTDPPKLMEIELIEPGLFLDRHEAAPERFAAAILAAVRGGTEAAPPGPPRPASRAPSRQAPVRGTAARPSWPRWLRRGRRDLAASGGALRG